MLQICRSEDGQVTEVDVSVWDLERLENLEYFLEEKSGVPHDAILAYLSDGRRLKEENIRDLAGVQDQTIYIFNKRYLDLDLNQTLRELWVEPALQSPVEDSIASTPPFRISQFAASYLHSAHAHNEHIKHTLSSLNYQHSALRIASGALDLHALAIADVFEGIAHVVEREILRQSGLLAGLDADLEIVGRVAIHKEFMSPAVRKAMEVGDRGRPLGDYVSRVKMRQVADSCTKTHEELRVRFRQAQEAMSRLNQGTDEVRAAVTDQNLLEDAGACARRSQEVFDKIVEINSLAERSNSAPERLLQDFRQLDTTLRSELQFITKVKNSSTEHCIVTLRHISALNNDLVELPPLLSNLQQGLKAKTSFSHIQRLHNMLYAYGATVVEIVRRKEFARFFYRRAQSILEVMAKLSANERKRRQVYRGEVHGQLPFETRGMDDPVPSIDFSPTGSPDSPYSLERADVDGLLKVLDDIEHFAQTSQDPAALGSVREARAGLEKLIAKMDSLESSFDRIAERSLLSASRLSNHRRRSTDADIELEIQVQELRQAQAEQDATFQNQRSALEAEIAQLRNSLQMSETARSQVERDLHSVKAQLDSESTSRRILEERNAELSSDADGHRESLARALAEATEQTKAAEIVRQELAQVHAEFKHVKAVEKQHSDKLAFLLEEQALTLTRLEEARARGEDLEMQIQAARVESDEVKCALVESGKEKDRLLRVQASEHDRLMRDHIAEADGDRAVLEHQFSELKAALEDTERQLKDARAQAEMALADTVGLREELQRVEHELREAQHVERVLRDDIRDGRASQSNYEQKLEDSSRLVAQFLDVALAFRDSHVKAMLAAQVMSSHPGANKMSNNSNLADSSVSPGRHSIINHLGEPPPIDPSDPAAALEALRAFDHDHFQEVINKAGSTIRKWQKQCKEYRERAKGKISFRNFAKGDLALFLPTRNSVSKPWAAFNGVSSISCSGTGGQALTPKIPLRSVAVVSFPHYFLQASGHFAEQLKTREWIVARITSITERVVDHKTPSTNPYGLGDGVKYYMLEVEDWTQPAYPSKRRESRKVSSEVQESVIPPVREASPLPPPENEVEDSFSATRPPTSRLFPGRTRANSSPTAGPSSLSRLLAQAGPNEAAPEANIAAMVLKPRSPSPAASQPPPPSPPQPDSIPRAQGSHGRSPLRPGSRASRVSTSSRLSRGHIPFGSTSTAAKAIATTAISEQAVAGAHSPGDVISIMNGRSQGSSIPSPEESPTEGMSHLVTHRRRTTSYHVTPRPVTSALSTTLNASSPFFGTGTGTGTGSGVSASSRLASLASSWGAAFGRRKKLEPPENVVTSPTEATATLNAISPRHVLGNTSPILESPSNSTSEYS
ncbi:hypothetical protein AcV7_002650 [Taiwanofungus camphoratus]|nr:hypothetical protein AcV7_002650 [Antrodia cinnamomea]